MAWKTISWIKNYLALLCHLWLSHEIWTMKRIVFDSLSALWVKLCICTVHECGARATCTYVSIFGIVVRVNRSHITDWVDQHTEKGKIYFAFLLWFLAKPKTLIRSQYLPCKTASKSNSVCRSNLGLNFPMCAFFLPFGIVFVFFGSILSRNLLFLHTIRIFPCSPFLHRLDHHHHRHQTWDIFHLCCNCIIAHFALESGRKTEHSKFITYI